MKKTTPKGKESDWYQTVHEQHWMTKKKKKNVLLRFKFPGKISLSLYVSSHLNIHFKVNIK